MQGLMKLSPNFYFIMQKWSWHQSQQNVYVAKKFLHHCIKRILSHFVFDWRNKIFHNPQ